MREIKKLDDLTSKHTLLKFWAPWCGPCKTMSPVYQKISDTNNQIEVVSVNVDDPECQDLVEKFKVRGIPAGVVLTNLNEVHRFTGVTPLATMMQVVNNVINTETVS